MLPLTHKDNRSFSPSIKDKILGWFRLIFADKASRNIFLFLLLNLSFAFVELFYGIWTNSLGKNNLVKSFSVLIKFVFSRSYFGFIPHVLRLYGFASRSSSIGYNQVESQ